MFSVAVFLWKFQGPARFLAAKLKFIFLKEKPWSCLSVKDKKDCGKVGIAVIEYYIDGSAKESTIGAGIVKINEYGFIEKHHFTIEHVNPTSQIAEGYALQKAFEMIRGKRYT